MKIMCLVYVMFLFASETSISIAQSVRLTELLSIEKQKLLACFTDSHDFKVPAATMYDDCKTGLRFMAGEMKRDKFPDTLRLTQAILKIYLSSAAHELHRDAESRTLFLSGREDLLNLSKSASSDDVRYRAKKMEICLIERDATCNKEWRNSAATGHP